jgi:hypothetical protein
MNLSADMIGYLESELNNETKPHRNSACMVVATPGAPPDTNFTLTATSAAKTLVERRLPPDAKLLIVHADDLGMATPSTWLRSKDWRLDWSVQAVMIPCSLASEIAAYARDSSWSRSWLAPDAYQRVEPLPLGPGLVRARAVLWTAAVTSTRRRPKPPPSDPKKQKRDSCTNCARQALGINRRTWTLTWARSTKSGFVRDSFRVARDNKLQVGFEGMVCGNTVSTFTAWS